MKFIKLSLVAALAVSAAVAGGDITPAEPVTETKEKSAFEVSANLALTSNYVWRGMTQTANSPAVQGGIDLGYKGFYLGTWGSNVEFGNTDNNLEADFYAGYKNELAGVAFDIGYIYYAYPNESDAFNFDELYIGLSKDFGMVGINGKYSFGLDSNIDTTDYWEIGADLDLPMEFTLAASYGDYDEVGSNYLVSLSKSWGKFDFTIAYTDFSSDTSSQFDEDHFIATVSTSF
jgi:uncharacterized protein (TIGR02001 family)